MRVAGGDKRVGAVLNFFPGLLSGGCCGGGESRRRQLSDVLEERARMGLRRDFEEGRIPR